MAPESSYSRKSFWFLAAFTVLGLVLRVMLQIDRQFAGDEVGTLFYMRESYGYLWTHFESPWMTMNFYLMLVKFIAATISGNVWVWILPGLVAGLALIPVTAAVARRFTSERTALFAAFLMAVQPIMCQYSVYIRSYSLLLVFLMLALVFLVDWLDRRRWREGVGFSVCMALALIAQLNAVYVGCFYFVMGLVLWSRSRENPLSRENLRSSLSIIVPGIVALVAVAAMYAPLMDAIRAYRVKWQCVPPTEVWYLAEVFTRYFGDRYYVFPAIVLIILGLWSATQYEKKLLWLALGVVTPITIMSLLGVSGYPGAMARWMMGGFPFLLIIIAEGIAYLGRSRKGYVSVIAALVLVATWVPEFHRQVVDSRDRPWDQVASLLREEAGPNDRIVVINQWFAKSELTAFFLDEQDLLLGPGMLKPEMFEPDVAGRLIIVNPGKTIRTRARDERIGTVQVVIYDDESMRDVAVRAIRNIKRTLRGRIAPQNAELYELLIALSPGILTEEERRAYTIRFYESSSRQRRMQRRPSQFNNNPDLIRPRLK